MYICASVHLCVRACACVRVVCMCACACVRVRVCVHVSVSVCVHVYVCVSELFSFCVDMLVYAGHMHRADRRLLPRCTRVVYTFMPARLPTPAHRRGTPPSVLPYCTLRARVCAACCVVIFLRLLLQSFLQQQA